MKTRQETGEQYQHANEPNWPLLGALRFFLAVVVFNEHIRLVEGDRWLSALFGGGAVASFFVISGFSMAHSLSKGSKGFYERRFYRIWPVYIFSLAVALIPMFRGEGVYAFPGGGMSEIPDQRAMILNALMLQPLMTMPLGTNGPTWSLGIEAMFYLIIPYYARLKLKPRMVIFLASCVFTFWATRYTSIPLEQKGKLWPYLGFFWLFAGGFELFKYKNDRRVQHAALAAPMVVGAAAGLGTVTMAVSILLVLHQSKVEISPQWQKNLTYLGELSYPLYVLHDPVMAIINQSWPRAPIPIYYIGGLLAAILVYHTIDAPLRKWHRKRQRHIGERAKGFHYITDSPDK